MDIYEVREIYTKIYFVRGTEEEALENCNDSTIDPVVEFVEGTAKKISQRDIKQAANHQGDDDYILWDAEGEELHWADYITDDRS